MSTNLANPNIKHVFVLMLENRSFDHMLGFLTGTGPTTGNSYQGEHYPSTNNADFIMPFDPGHEFPDVIEQLCGAGNSYRGGAYPPINSSGFVSNYATTKSPGEGGATNNFGEIMKCYQPALQLPVMATLAGEFAICDHWFSSLPGPTWPNRFFVHAASSSGLDHSPRFIETTEWETIKGFSFLNGTIFQLMDKNNKSWRIYRGVETPIIGSIPSVAALTGINLSLTHRYENFSSDINGVYPYSYTFIEPNYGDIVNNTYSGGQSQHPMDDVRNGETLIKSTYEAIRNSPLWPSSLLIIIYDEHGGFYDHVPPPSAIAPGDTTPNSKYNQFGFNFEQYGVRVPALVISAFTEKNKVSNLLYDHSSIPATLEALFNMPSLTQRDAHANNLTALATLTEPRMDTPLTLPNPATINPEYVAAARALQPVEDEASSSVDSGNLPGFLHICLKAEREREPVQENKNLVMDRFISRIRTKADARVYLESSLPSFLR